MTYTPRTLPTSAERSSQASPATTLVPRSIAIAGAWGYIGQKFLRAALDLGIIPYVFDPGLAPADIDPRTIHRIETETDFYNVDADIFHLAVHPDARRVALAALFARSSQGRGPVILCEKPIAPPEDPELCDWIVSEAQASNAALYFDFPELFDPMTLRIQQFLAGFSEVQFNHMRFIRSKDREDPANPRNYKIMVHIQYQETVHCLAFLLSILALRRRGDLNAVCRSIRAEGKAAHPVLPYV